MKIGTRLCGPFGERAVITEIYGTPAPETVLALGGGCVMIGGGCDVTFIDDSGIEHHRVPEAIILAPYARWKVIPGEADAEEIAGLLAAASIAKTERAVKAEEAKRAFAAAKVRLLHQHPNLLTDGDYLTRAAKNIRLLLKAAFPGTKFSVTTDRFSGGNSLSVKWTDGPPSHEVEAIAGPFSAGDFDGMTDCYNYRESPWTALFGEAKYVHTYRAHSDAALRAAVIEAVPHLDPDEAAKAYRYGRLDYHDARFVRAALKEI